MAALLSLSAVLAFPFGVSAVSSPYDSVTVDQWAALNTSVNGRLFAAVPIAQPCFDSYSGIVDSDTLAPNSAACSSVESVWTVSFSSALISSRRLTCSPPEHYIPCDAIWRIRADLERASQRLCLRFECSGSYRQRGVRRLLQSWIDPTLLCQPLYLSSTRLS